jgi:predicted transcriptional regulator
MKIAEIINIINGKVTCGHDLLETEITHAFSSDLLSDVLTINRTGILLITGVVNIQTIRTAEMAEISCILLVRNKKASLEMIELAKDNGLVIVESPVSMFYASGKLYQCGIQPLY